MPTFDEILDGMDLPSARGGKRGAAPLALSLSRELGPEDLDLILNPPPLGSAPPSISSLRHSHHQLAKILADGAKDWEASAITGYSASRISILKDDPAFKELLTYYASQKVEIYADVHKRLAAVGMDAVEQLHEKLNDIDNPLTTREIREIAEFALDRSSAPKKTGPGGLNVNLGAGASPSNFTISFVAPESLPAPASAQQMIDVTPSRQRDLGKLEGEQ